MKPIEVKGHHLNSLGEEVIKDLGKIEKSQEEIANSQRRTMDLIAVMGKELKNQQ
jgi:hypothetical protein